MNSMSFGEVGGRLALVEAGSVLVGWPGAPGCTTAGGASCAHTTCGTNARAATASGTKCDDAIPISEHSLDLKLDGSDFMDFKVI
jgi:hypothetical protein